MSKWRALPLARRNWRLKLAPRLPGPIWTAPVMMSKRRTAAGDRTHWTKVNPIAGCLTRKALSLMYAPSTPAWRERSSLPNKITTPGGGWISPTTVYLILWLGYNALNEWFSGSHGHHINREDVIYIPEKIHVENKHSLTNKKSMQQINQLAWDFLLATVI